MATTVLHFRGLILSEVMANLYRSTYIYKTFHRKQKIEQRKHHLKPWVNSGAPER
jgi:hypothetical protein